MVDIETLNVLERQVIELTKLDEQYPTNGHDITLDNTITSLIELLKKAISINQGIIDSEDNMGLSYSELESIANTIKVDSNRIDSLIEKQHVLRRTRSNLTESMSAEIHDDEKVYKGFLKVHKQIIQHESFSGGDMIVTREVIKGNNAVGLILYDSILKKVLLIRQFRVGSFDWMLEIVAGLNDKNENEIDLVIREAKEEAGVDVKQITKVVEYFVNPGNSTDKVTIYAGLFDSTKVVDNSVHGLEIEGEDIRIELYTINEIKKMMKNGLLNSAMTIISMNWLINNV